MLQVPQLLLHTPYKYLRSSGSVVPSWVGLQVYQGTQHEHVYVWTTVIKQDKERLATTQEDFFALIPSLLLSQVRLIEAVVPSRHQTMAFAVVADGLRASLRVVVDDGSNNWVLAYQNVARNNKKPINNKVIYITLLEWSF